MQTTTPIRISINRYNLLVKLSEQHQMPVTKIADLAVEKFLCYDDCHGIIETLKSLEAELLKNAIGTSASATATQVPPTKKSSHQTAVSDGEINVDEILDITNDINDIL